MAEVPSDTTERFAAGLLEDAQASRQNLVFLTRETQKSLLDLLTRIQGLWPGSWGDPARALSEHPVLLEWLFDKPQAASLGPLDPWLRLSLSSDQWQAARALESQPLSFIEGPAGSGKSWLLSRLAGVALSQGKRVLITTPCPGALADLGHVFPKGPPPGSADLIKRLDRLEHLQFERIKKECSLALPQRRLNQGKGCHDWIPGAIHRGIPMPLSEQEVVELYSLSDLEEEGDSKLHGSLPDPNKLLTVNELARLKELDEFFRNYEDQLFWANTHHAPDALDALLEVTGPLQEMLAQAPEWWLLAAWAAKKGGEDGQAWGELSVKLDRLERERTPLLQKIKAPRFELPAGPLDEQLAICQELLAHVASKGNVGWVAFKPRWKRFLEHARVNGTRPSTAEDFGWLAARLKSDLLLAQALEATKELMARLSIKGSLGDQDPAPAVRQAVRDFPDYFAEFHRRAGVVGLRWEKAMSHSTRSKLPPGGELGLFRVGLTEMLIPLIGRRQQFVELAELRHKEEQHLDWVPATGKVGLGAGDKQRDLRSTLRATVVARDIQGYREALARLVKIKRYTIYNERRSELLTRLEAVAPEWARAIKEHRSPHDKTTPPGPAEPAWHYLQSQYILESAADASLDDLAEGIRGIRNQISEGVPTSSEGLTICPLEGALASHDSYDLVLVDHAHRCALPALGILARGQQVVLLGDADQPGPPPPAGPVRGGPDERFDGWHSLLELGRERARLAGGVGLPTDVAELLGRLGGDYPSRPGLVFSPLEPLKDYPVEADRQEQEAAALAVTLLRQEEYAGLTVAVVTLGGPGAARRIGLAVEEELDESERALFAALDPDEAQGRRFDVVLVCLAERSSGAGPLLLRNNPQYLGWLRVALTRARMQVFVVHALDATRHLVPGDLRRNLLEALSHPAPPDEFPDTFRGSLARDLVKAGYRVRRYDPFGLRVEGRSGAALLFCYSDETESYTMEDLAREGWLEQAGWRVLGLSGREYWRDPAPFVSRLCGQLQLETLDPLAGQALESRLRQSARQLLGSWPRLTDPAEPLTWSANAFPLAFRELGARLLAIQGVRIEPGGEPGTLAEVEVAGYFEALLESDGAACLERVKQLLASPPPPRPRLVSAAPEPKGETSGEREPPAGLTPKPGTPGAAPESADPSLRAGLVQRAGTKGQPPAPTAEGKRGLVERNPEATPVEGKRGLVERSPGGGSKRGFLDRRPARSEPAPSAPEIEAPEVVEASLPAPEVAAWPEAAEASLPAPEVTAWPEKTEASLPAPEVTAWPEATEAPLPAPEATAWPEIVEQEPEAVAEPEEPEPVVPEVVEAAVEEAPAEPAPLRAGLVQRGGAKGQAPVPEGKRGLVERQSAPPAEGKRGLVERSPAGGAKRGFLDKRPSKAEPAPTPEPEAAAPPPVQAEAEPELAAAPEVEAELEQAVVESHEVEPEQAEEEAEPEQAEEEAEQAEQAEEEAKVEEAEEEAEPEQAEEAEPEQAEEEAEPEQAEEEAEPEQAEEEAEPEQAEEEAEPEQAEEEAEPEQAEEEAEPEQAEEQAEEASSEVPPPRPEKVSPQSEPIPAEQKTVQVKSAQAKAFPPAPARPGASAQSMPAPVQFQPVVEFQPVSPPPSGAGRPGPPRRPTPSQPLGAPGQIHPVVPPSSEPQTPPARAEQPSPPEPPPPPPAPEPAPHQSEPRPAASSRPGPPRPASGRQSAPSSPAFPVKSSKPPSAPPAKAESASSKPPDKAERGAIKPPSVKPPESSAIRLPSVGPPDKAESSAIKPPSIKPPDKAESGAIKPPSVRPPAKAESGAIKPPSVRPPAKAESGAIKPPSVKPPDKNESGAIKPPSVNPPDKTESGAIKPPSVKPPVAKAPTSVKPPAAVKPPASQETASVKPPAAKPPTSSSVKPPSASSVKPPSVKPPSVKPPGSQETVAVKPTSLETPPVQPPKSAVKPPTKPGPPKSPPVDAKSAVKPPSGKLSVQPPSGKLKSGPVTSPAEPEPSAPAQAEPEIEAPQPETPTRQGLVEKGGPRKLTKKGGDKQEGKVRPGLVERTGAEASPKRGLVERTPGSDTKRVLEKNPGAETAPKRGLVEKAGPAASAPASKPAVRPKELPRAMSAQRTEAELAEIRETMLKEFLEFRPAEPTFTELGGGAAQVEERRAPRMKCSFKVRCFVGLSSFEAHVNEISLTGIRIETPERLAKGAIIEMHPATTSGNVLAVRCEARWCRRISDSETLSCGLAFTEDAAQLSRSWAAVVLHGITHRSE